MTYIIATTKDQPKNEFGGRNFVKLGTISNTTGIAAAKKEAKAKYGKDTVVMTPSEWEFLSNPDNARRIRAS